MHGAIPAPERRILFLDAYDSFTNNVVSLLKDALGSHVRVHVVHMDLRTMAADPTPDWTRDDFLHRLPDFDAVVCGPGPGSPLCAADVGAFKLLWDLPPDRAVPVLGICLGFQSLVEHFGGAIRRVRRGGLHGMVRRMEHAQRDVFDGVAPAFPATLYHSLCADIGQHDVPDEAWPDERWTSPRQAPDLVPLAWILDRHEDEGVEDNGHHGNGHHHGNDHDKGSPERILMAVRHATLPFWGLQYHPESVCTDQHGAHAVLQNWFRQALQWNATRRAGGVRSVPSTNHVDSLDPGLHSTRTTPPRPTSSSSSSSSLSSPSPSSSCQWRRDLQTGLARRGLNPGYSCRQIKLPADVDTADLAEVLGLGASDTIILDSSSTINGDPLARNSIIALDVQDALRLEYHVGDDYVLLRQPATSSGRPEECQTIRLVADDGDDAPHGPVDPWSPWHVLSEYWAGRKVISEEGGDGAVPCPAFKGGFMGFVTYEMGLSTLSPGSVTGEAGGRSRGHHRPDVCMAWVSKSIVLDHMAGIAYIQSLTTEDLDDAWIDGVAHTIQTSRAWRHPACSHGVASKPVRCNEALLDAMSRQRDALKTGERLHVSVPDARAYEADVLRCQEYIRRGESYELCLTAQTTMTRPRGHDQPHHTRMTTSTTTTTTAMATATRTTAAAAAASSDERQPQLSKNSPSQDHQTPSSSSSSSSSLHETPWQIYRALRARQPAPFGSFTRLGGATLISCSPERFLSHDPNGLCVMRPMKGTVRKSPACSTLAQAEKVLHIPKEEAENLMIVDLIRHDLYGVCGAQSVTVPHLLVVEEYATVFQMVTAVHGQLPPHKVAAAAAAAAPSTGQAETDRGAGADADADAAAPFTAMHVLASCLPPGSMTGAPKKRSCEILQTIEPRERSVYAGVIGYLDVQGHADWSVTIRTMFRWDDERCPDDEDREVWRIGAGGAVTTLSTAAGETEEMFTKLCGPLGTFVDTA
ncbi:hypothetical protein E4U43_003679 [Claviceps pusilla]|uniref:aminodeoxychorismate synthase n=1 Tax=Claviceps pusilla TaxID=123648 RepID=A0A9P7SXE2_9HYPO|nr:hypothetical protein E4U43_003679 [Claviceps pusilla]